MELSHVDGIIKRLVCHLPLSRRVAIGPEGSSASLLLSFAIVLMSCFYYAANMA